MEDTLFNICIPFHNSSKYFHELLDSIISQTYKNWKIYIFDDGSDKEESKKLDNVVRPVADKVEVIKSKHIGVYKSRIQLIKNVKEGYIICVDADDKFASNDVLSAIKNQIEISNADIIYYNYSLGIGNKLGQITKFKPFNNIESTIKEALNNEKLNTLCNKAINVENLNDIVFPELENVYIAEDRLLSILILLNCKTVSYIDKVFYYYRDNTLSASNVRLDTNRLFCQFDVEKEIQNILKTKINYFYNPDVYILESVVYPYLWFTYKNCKDKKLRKQSYEETYKILISNCSTSKIPQTNPIHKKLCLQTLANKRFRNLDALFKTISGLKRVRDLKWKSS